MIIKPCAKSMRIQAQEALLRRLPILHPSRRLVEEDMRKSLAGYRGEMEVNRYLKRLDHPDLLIFHGLRLTEMKGEHFQMDFLIVTPSFFLIIEVKNYAGEIHLERDYPQLIQIKNGVTTAFRDPIIQVIRQKNHFKEWLKHYGFHPISIEYLVVLTNHTAIIKISPDHYSIFEFLINNDYLLLKIEELQQKYQTVIYSQVELHNLSTLLLTSDNPLQTSLLQKYHVRDSELLNGVHCPQCFALPMTRKWGKWNCNSCGYTSKNAYMASLLDYTLLKKQTITNKEMRLFFGLESETVSQRILASMSLEYTGITKNREYILVHFKE